jgi:hypothetical protein
MDLMLARQLVIKLPDVDNEKYAELAYAVHGALVAAGLADDAALEPDEQLTDQEANAVHDRAASTFPWGP